MTDILSRLRDALSDRYEIIREAGQGGMATVYLARDRKHDRDVAIKVLLPDLAASVGPDRFLREIEIAARLQHPHILPVYDSGQADGLLYYVMPFVAGESLQDRLVNEGPLPAHDAARLASEVAGALDFAHRQGVVHRDIKPANILISDGHAVVADFGIARAISVSGGAGLTQAGMAIGTPSYMSPEQALGETELDGRTDIYALGCVLYEMLVGSPPYEGTTPQAIIAKAISGTIPRLTTDPARLQPTIERAMAREPGDRFQSAADLRDALTSGFTGPVAAGRPARRWLAAGAVTVLAALAIVVLRPRGYQVEGDPRHSLIVFPFENRTTDTDNDYLEEASMNLLGLAISHWEDMRVYDDERTSSLMRRRGVERPSDVDFDVAQAMARDARVGTLVLGDIRREGDSLAIEAKVHDVATGERLATEIVRAGYDADPRSLLDSLAGRILQVSGAPPGVQPALVAQTTRSLEAYRAYLRGVAALQQFEIDSARASLERAVELDSTFALAYLRLRDVDGWAGIEGNPERQRELTAKAQLYSASLPPRFRVLVQFHAAYQDNQLARARRLVDQLIERDSGDVEAWYQLGEAHFHDYATRFPHPDTAGNLGTALRAFEHTLALDSNYVLAYQHILDVLASCAANAPWVCLPGDSAVYGRQQDLAARFGAAQVEAWRQDAADRRLRTARAWVEAAPRSARARSQLLELLVDRDLLDDARAQLANLRQTSPTTARLWDARILLRQTEYAAAADSMVRALEHRAEIFRLLFSGGGDGPQEAFAILSAGGRWRELRSLAAAVGQTVASFSPGGTAQGPGNVELPFSTLVELIEVASAVELGIAPDLIARGLAGVRAAIDTLYPRGDRTVAWAVSSLGGLIAAAYLQSRDTTVLTGFIAEIDTADSRTWRAMDGHVAATRGDTAAALARLQGHALAADDVEFSGDPGTARVMVWADLAAQLGRHQDAIRLYGLMDSTDRRMGHPALHVRSWAERAALYQILDQTDSAVAFYDRFIAAWAGGDDEVQPMVERARAARAGLLGESYPAVERR